MSAAVDALKIFAIVEKTAMRWKGPRGPSAKRDAAEPTDEALQDRRRAFLIREARQEQHTQMLLEKRKHAAATVRKALRDKAKDSVISRPLRRFSMKLRVNLVYHQYNASEKSEVVTTRLVVMDDSIKWEDLDNWARTCIGLPKRSGKEATLRFEYVSQNGHPTIISGKAPLQCWMDNMWAVHPPTLHAFDSEGLLNKALDRTEQIKSIFNE